MDQQRKILLPLIAIFIIFSGSVTACKNLLAKADIDYRVLLIANILFFLLSLFSFFKQKRALANSNPNVFVRGVLGGILLKMFVCVAGVLVYKLIAGDNLSKLSVFAAMFLYLFYLGLEVSAISKLNKQKNA